MGSFAERDAAYVTAPISGTLVNDKHVPQWLRGTGSTVDKNDYPLETGQFGELQAGGQAILYVMGETTSSVSSVTHASASYLPAGGTKSWVVEKNSRVVFTCAADGSSAYDAWVFNSSR